MRHRVRIESRPSVVGVFPTGRRPWRVAAVTSLLALVLTGCITHENKLSDSDERALPERFDTVAPDLQKFDIYAGGDGFNVGDNLSVAACPESGVSVADARAQLRKIARVVWNHAETSWEDLTVSTHCHDDLEGTRRKKSKPAEGLELEMSAAGANQLWGEPSNVDHDSESSPVVKRNAKVGAGARFKDFDGGGSYSLSEDYRVYGPEPHDDSRLAWWEVQVPHGTSERPRKEDLDQIIEKLWHEHPGRLAGIGIHAIPLYPPDRPDDSKSQQEWEKNRPDWRSEYSAKQLQDRFGSRAADLPQ